MNQDPFAQIALRRADAWRRELIQPAPARLPDRRLPLRPTEGPAASRREVANPGPELERALAQLRRDRARFLRNFAPPLRTPRLRQSLETFDWRLETAEDRRNFAGVVAGRGAWQSVAIPHYGPPEGRATAYYRTEFSVTPAMLKLGAIFLCFRGVDYKAQVFVNGAMLGGHEGFFAPFEFNCTPHVRQGRNTVLIKVENDSIIMGNASWDGPAQATEGDKIYAATGPGYDDPAVGWHHCPPGMGIYQAVTVEARARIFVGDLFVRPMCAAGQAELWVEIFNCDQAQQSFALEFAIFGRNFRRLAVPRKKWRPRTIQVPGLSDMPKPGDNAVIELTLGPGPNLFKIPVELPKFREWSPETPWLYQAQLSLLDVHGIRRDAAERQFGMRSFGMNVAAEPRGNLTLNGRPIRLRGANTMGFEQQRVMRHDWQGLCDDLLLAKAAHFNFLRLTQRPVQEEVYEWCDRVGLMTQTDLPLFGCLRRNQMLEAVRQAGEMERLIRGHPCNVLVSYINEPFPNGQAKPHRHLLRTELDDFFQLANLTIHQLNPERVIKPVDGDYDPPSPGLPDIHCYNGWYLGSGLDLGELHKGYWQRVKPGWQYGCGEFGAEGLDPEATMRRHYPAEWLPRAGQPAAEWTPDRIVKAQTGPFHHLWFETPRSLSEWVDRSQGHQAWVTKLMTEAFRRDRRMVSFAIHLFIDAFPAGWMKAIVDVDRQPKPAYHAYRAALTPAMVSLRCDRRAYFGGEATEVEAWICNDRSTPLRAGRLRYSLAVNNRPFTQGETAARAGASDSAFAGFLRARLPAVDQRSVLRVIAHLSDAAGRLLHENEIQLDVFPAVDPAPRPRVRRLGARDGPAARFAADLGFSSNSSRPELILIDDFAAFAPHREQVAEWVRSGATALFFGLPLGRSRIGGTAVEAFPCTMGARHFVARDTGHPLVNGFGPEDFKFWMDEAAGHPTPLLHRVFQGPGWRPILRSGNQIAPQRWAPLLAAAEKPEGAGRWRVCLLQLSGRLRTNPAARMFAERLIRP